MYYAWCLCKQDYHICGHKNGRKNSILIYLCVCVCSTPFKSPVTIFLNGRWRKLIFSHFFRLLHVWLWFMPCVCRIYLYSVLEYSVLCCPSVCCSQKALRTPCLEKVEILLFFSHFTSLISLSLSLSCPHITYVVSELSCTLVGAPSAHFAFFA